MQNTDTVTQEHKLCITCQFVGTNSIGDWERFKCFAPENMVGINPVNGAKVAGVELCKDQRNDSYVDFRNPKTITCKAAGNWWKAAPSKVIQPTLAESITYTDKIVKNKSTDDLLKDLGV